PALERLHEAAVHRLEHVKALFGDAMRTLEIVNLNVDGLLPCRSRAFGRRRAGHQAVDVRLRERLRRRGARRGHWMTNCGKKTLRTAPFGKIGDTASSTCCLIRSRCVMSVRSSTDFLPSNPRM